MCSTHARGFRFSDDLYQIASPEGGARLLFAEVDFGYGDLTAVYGRDGKVLKSSNNLFEEWTFEYRKDHTVVTDALGRTEVYGFDENRELVYRIDADEQRSDSERDGYGRITVERDPLGRESRQ